MVTEYIPQRGDIIWLDFNPQAGREQKGKRPALVISPYEYNKKTSLALCCPITSKVKGYPFEVKLNGTKISGVVLADQIKCLDWKIRNSKKIESADVNVVRKAVKLIKLLIENE